MDFRVDEDSMGKINVPTDAYYGPQTMRSLQNFCIGNDTFPPEFIIAYAIVKQAAAIVNNELSLMSDDVTHLVVRACQEIIDGKLLDQFPLRVWQTGSGTQTNMNVNEVIANRANELAGQGLGKKLPTHPNDHVNLSQSTNDSFPTAMHISTVMQANNILLPAINSLVNTFDQKAMEFKDVIKMGRTHLQDATPVTLGQEMGSYSAQLKLCKSFIKNAITPLYELALGGTAVGTGLNTHPDYASMVAKEIANKTGFSFITAKNKFSVMAAHDAMAYFSGALNTLACALMKIANDIRWLASGPRGGLGEISIAENEPGSSIMPGKVNPTQAEAVTMICCQVMGNHTAVSVACSQGNFELNVFKPVIIKNVLHSIELLAQGVTSFNEKCACSINANIDRLQEMKDRSLMLVTALTPYIGYDQASLVAKTAHKENKTLKQVCLEMELMSEEEFDKRVDAKNMLAPNR